MRLVEIKEKVRNSRIPQKIFHEIWAMEVDTVNSDSPPAKHHLVDEMQRAVKTGTVYSIPLSRESKEYLVDFALPNMIDVARDNMDKRLVNSLQKFQARIHAKLVGVD